MKQRWIRESFQLAHSCFLDFLVFGDVPLILHLFWIPILRDIYMSFTSANGNSFSVFFSVLHREISSFDQAALRLGDYRWQDFGSPVSIRCSGFGGKPGIHTFPQGARFFLAVFFKSQKKHFKMKCLVGIFAVGSLIQVQTNISVSHP